MKVRDVILLLSCVYGFSIPSFVMFKDHEYSDPEPLYEKWITAIQDKATGSTELFFDYNNLARFIEKDNVLNTTQLAKLSEEVEQDLHRSGNCASPVGLYRDESITWGYGHRLTSEQLQDCVDSVRVLIMAFAQHYGHVGYCQGQMFVVQTLLTAFLFDSSKAFGIFTSLVSVYDMASIYEPKFSGLSLRLFQLDQLMLQRLPVLRQHLIENSIRPEAFATRWFISLYSMDATLSLIEHVKIIDLFLSQGWPFMFQLMLGILDNLAPKLLQLDDPEELSGVLQQLGLHIRTKDITELAFSWSRATTIRLNSIENDLQELEFNYKSEN